MTKKKESTPFVPVNPEVLNSIAAAATTPQNTTYVPGRGLNVTMRDLPMDEESREELGQAILAVRDLQGYANAVLSRRMEQVWGAFTSIRTGTDKDNSLIFLYKGDKSKKRVRVNRSGAQNVINFSLAVPLAKLELRPAADRQWNLFPHEIIVPDGPPVFMFNLVERDSVPRNQRDDDDESGGDEDVEAAASGSAAAKAVKGKGSAKSAKASTAYVDLDDDLDDEDEDD